MPTGIVRVIDRPTPSWKHQTPFVYLPVPHPVIPTSADLEGNALGVSTASGSLGSQIETSAAASMAPTATGALDVLTAIAGAANALASASAALQQSTALSGDAVNVSSAAANMTMALELLGTATAQASASGGLSSVSNLVSAAQAVATAAGALDQALAIAGVAGSVAAAAGSLANTVAMYGSASAEATAMGNLSLGEVISGGITYAVNLATGAVTNWTNAEFERLITAHGRTYALKGGVLYRIGGDVDPGDVQIDSPVRFAQQSFGTNILKTLDKVYVQARSQDGLAVTPIYDEELGLVYTLDADDVASIRPRKIPIGRGNYWFTMGMLIQNRDGGPMDIGGIEMIVNQNLRRVR